ncbi:MAG: helicase HerA domain-containing protein, partial [Clostridium sp.]
TNSDLMNIAIKLNALNCASSGEPYNENQCKAISVPNKSKNSLEEIYDASHWVTFIDPKVDLNFFKNDPDAKDLLIIHYSDQYTTAGGYDAITVTRKSTPYQRVIEEFLTKKDVENAEDYSPGIINMFNAINGDWLLRLLSSKSHFPKEKISILSAVKLALAEFKNDRIIWVPISLEEVLRVSGGAGLKQTEGLFSAKNLGFDNGVTSDDILLVGVEEVNGKVLVHYYPVEVKIGENTGSYIQKGIEQAKSTKKILNETLLPKDGEELSSTQKVYRNFLMQLVITSAEKLNLYNVCNEFDWSKIIDSDLRRKLLNEEYEIINELSSTIGEAGVISFKRGLINKDKHVEDEVLIIEMSEEDGINFITKSVEEIYEIVEGGIEREVSDSLNEEETIIEKEVEHVETNYTTGDGSLVDSTEELECIADKPKGDKDYIDRDVFVPPHMVTPEVLVEDKNIEVLFGFNKNTGKEIVWYPNDTDKVFHTNTGIIGTMGTGKTQFTKSLITQLYRESKYNVGGKDIGILIFDYKGDYNKSKTDFIEATDANVYKLHRLPFNPFSISLNDDPMPMLPAIIASTFSETIIKAFGLGKKQEALLEDLIEEAYEKRGILSYDPDTWTNMAPTLKDVYDIYEAREDIKKDDSLYAAFRKLIKLQVFEPDPSETKALFDLIDGVTVIDLSGYDPGMQNLVVAITLDLFYSQMQAYGHSKIDGSKRQLNKMILVDEADNFLSKNFESLKKILKEGREFGVGTILSTQLLSHFSTGDNEYANYILTWIIHNVADLSGKDVKYIFNTQKKDEEEHLFNRIKSLNKHESLVKMGGSDSAIHMKDRAFWELEK